MNRPPFSSDDPRLTAYALGELQGAECAEVEAAVRVDPALQAAVVEIRALAGKLEGVFAAEPAEAVLEPKPEVYKAKITRFPYYLVSGLAAACFAVVVALRKDRPVEGKVRQIELNFATEAAPAPVVAMDSAVVEREGPVAARAFAVMAAKAEAAPQAPARGGAVTANPGFVAVRRSPRSTVVPDFDRDGFARVRGAIEAGLRPVPASVEVEDLLNHFAYAYREPDGTAPVATDLEVAGAPWNPNHRLIRIGLRARGEAGSEDRPAALVARDARIQVNFNPVRVDSYRLIGYERSLAGLPDEAGADLTAGQTLTALYEVMLVEALAEPGMPAGTNLLTLSIGYRLPEGGDELRLDASLTDEGAEFAAASSDFKFAAAVAGFGLILRESPNQGLATYDQVIVWAEAGLEMAVERTREADDDGGRPAFVSLVRLALAATNG